MCQAKQSRNNRGKGGSDPGADREGSIGSAAVAARAGRVGRGYPPGAAYPSTL